MTIKLADQSACAILHSLIARLLLENEQKGSATLLANDFLKQATAIRRPSQDEFLSAQFLFLLNNQRYPSYLLRLIKDQPNHLSSRNGRTPASG